MRILIVEDNQKLADGLRQLLGGSGFAVDLVHDGEAALSALSTLAYDLVILDLGLPILNGFDVLKEMRAGRSQIPVLILTARGDLDDRVRGLDFGADDYMTKPFEVSELEARVRALMRRSSATKTSMVKFGPLTFDLRTGQTAVGSEILDIPAREINVLRELIMANNRVLSKSQLIESLSSFDDDISENAIEQYISRLRKRLVNFGVSIKVARGLGYYLHGPE